jgi:FMN reductase
MLRMRWPQRAVVVDPDRESAVQEVAVRYRGESVAPGTHGDLAVDEFPAAARIRSARWFSSLPAVSGGIPITVSSGWFISTSPIVDAHAEDGRSPIQIFRLDRQYVGLRGNRRMRGFIGSARFPAYYLRCTGSGARSTNRTGPGDMDEPVKVVGLGGSLAPASKSLAALKVAMRGAESAGAQVELFDIRVLDLPLYTPSMKAPEAALHMCDAVHAADGLIWSSPMYHGTISGSFKNALDWFELLRKREPPYLTDKIIGLASTAGGVHGLQAVNTMEFVVRALRGFAVPLVVPVAKAWSIFDQEGQPLDDSVESQLEGLGREVAGICIRRRPGTMR